MKNGDKNEQKDRDKISKEFGLGSYDQEDVNLTEEPKSEKEQDDK